MAPIEHDGSVKGVLVICPSHRQMMFSHTAGDLYATGQMLAQSSIPNAILMPSMSNVVDMRNVHITRFYDHFPAYSHVLWFDDDMHWTPDLIRDMFAFGKGVTGVFYAKRELPLAVIGRPLDDENVVVKGFMSVKDVGGGVLLIKREVITDILEKMPETNDCRDPGSFGRAGITRMLRVFDPVCVDGIDLSEDYSFCHRARAAGHEIWANVVHPISHVGTFEYALRYQDVLDAQQQAQRKAA